MSEDNLSPGPSGPGPPMASNHSSLTTSSMTISSEEDSSEELEEESSLEESLSSQEDESEWYEDDYNEEDEEFLIDEEYLEEEFLQEDDYLDEETFLQSETDLFRKVFVEKKMHLKEREFQKHLEVEPTEAVQSSERGQIHSPDQIISIQTTTPSSSDNELKFATSGTPVILRDQSSQTEWPYFGRKLGMPLKSKTTVEQEAPSVVTQKKSEIEGFGKKRTDGQGDSSGETVESFPQGPLWDTIMNESFDKQEEEGLDSLPSSYQSVLKEILSELACHHELEKDMNMPLSKLMEGENRKKLGLLLKKNFSKYRDTIMWIMEKCESQKMSEKATTITYQVSTMVEPEQSDTEEILRHSTSFKKKLRLDAEWIRAKMKAHQSDGKLIAYHSGRNFRNLALLITCKGVAKFTYIVLEDCKERKIRGLVTNSGHATFYKENGGIWVSLSKLLGYYFPKDKYQKAWNWWNLSIHVHAPPIMCLTLKLNKYIHVQIRSQDKVIFCFFAPKQKRIYLNMGTKYKFVSLKLLEAMKNKSILETDPGPTSWKIQVLLGKISSSLKLLTLSDLEHFTKLIKLGLRNLRKRKARILF